MPKRTQKGLNKEAFLVRSVLDSEKIKQIPTRNGYGEGLVEAGVQNKNIMVLCCDLTDSTRSAQFKKAFPDRFVQMGVSEQSMASIAAGMALAGKVPFISSYAAFSQGAIGNKYAQPLRFKEQTLKSPEHMLAFP